MSSNQEYFCYECTRKYPDFGKYQTHIKLKHKEKQNQKAQMQEEEVGELEDRIYALLGDLAELHLEGVKSIEPENLLEEHRFIGQANYSTNLVVRTPYESEIDLLQEIPKDYSYRPAFETVLSPQQIGQVLTEINNQIKELSAKLSKQRAYWQFADPQDTTIDFQDEFSVLDIVKLIRNYPKRGLVLHRPQLTVFLVWIGRVCKPDMLRLVYEIVVSCWLSFENYLAFKNYTRSTRKNSKYLASFLEEPIDGSRYETQQFSPSSRESEAGSTRVRSFYVSMGPVKLSPEQIQKLIELVYAWFQTILNLLPQEKKSEEGPSARVKVQRI